MIIAFDQLQTERAHFIAIIQQFRGGGALGRDYALASQVRPVLDTGIGTHQHASRRDKVWNGKSDLLSSLCIIRGRSTLQIRLAIDNRRNAAG